MTTVAVFNASDDTVDMLTEMFDQHGFHTVNGHVSAIKRGEIDFVKFLAEHDPQVLVWDISPPYDKNWVFFTLLRTSAALTGRGIVVTTTHKAHLDAMAGVDTGAIEILGKPYDLDAVLAAVQRAMPSE